MKKICGSFRSLWLCLLIASMQRCTEQCALQLYCTSLIYVHSKSKVTENIFNLQEWHQNTKTFISYKHSLMKKKTKTCQEQPNLVSGCLIQDFYKTTTFPRRPPLSGPKSGRLIQVWLYCSFNSVFVVGSSVVMETAFLWYFENDLSYWVQMWQHQFS